MERIGFGRDGNGKIANCFNKKKIEDCLSIIEVNGVYYGIERPYKNRSGGNQIGGYSPTIPYSRG